MARPMAERPPRQKASVQRSAPISLNNRLSGLRRMIPKRHRNTPLSRCDVIPITVIMVGRCAALPMLVSARPRSYHLLLQEISVHPP